MCRLIRGSRAERPTLSVARYGKQLEMKIYPPRPRGRSWLSSPSPIDFPRPVFGPSSPITSENLRARSEPTLQITSPPPLCSFNQATRNYLTSSNRKWNWHWCDALHETYWTGCVQSRIAGQNKRGGWKFEMSVARGLKGKQTDYRYEMKWRYLIGGTFAKTGTRPALMIW